MRQDQIAMVRAIGFCGMLGISLAMSPHLRLMAGDSLVKGSAYLEAYRPYSYVAVGIAALGVMCLLARSVFAPR